MRSVRLGFLKLPYEFKFIWFMLLLVLRWVDSYYLAEHEMIMILP